MFLIFFLCCPALTAVCGNGPGQCFQQKNLGYNFDTMTFPYLFCASRSYSSLLPASCTSSKSVQDVAGIQCPTFLTIVYHMVLYQMPSFSPYLLQKSLDLLSDLVCLCLVRIQLVLLKSPTLSSSTFFLE